MVVYDGLYTWTETKLVEQAMRDLARRDYLQRHRGRLIPCPEYDLTTERNRDAFEYQWWGRHVAIISRWTDSDPVGFFRGFGPGIGGLCGKVEGLNSPGSTLHFDPRNIEWIIELPLTVRLKYPDPFTEEEEYMSDEARAERTYDQVIFERHNRVNPRAELMTLQQADLVVMERQDGAWEVWKDRYGVHTTYGSRDEAPARIQRAVDELAALR